MNGAVRQRKIREILDTQEFVDLETLCRCLEASESTIRRDLIALESDGVLKRVYGGAMAMQARDQSVDFELQNTRMADEKRRIAAAAAQLIEEGQTVLLDGGTTCAAVARALAGRSIHVITNSLPIAETFGDSRLVEVTLTGGYLYPRLRATIGPLCEQVLGSVSADVLVMGLGGITESGFSNSNSLVVGPERKMIEAARKVIVVADHTKFGRGAAIYVAPLDVADIVVSDTALAEEYREMLRARGVEVLLT
jgi:DeoR family transcriptional regulator, fructose operon transcriptional repressor